MSREHPTRTVAIPGTPDHVQVTASVRDTRQLEWRLLGFGGLVDVKRAIELRELVRKVFPWYREAGKMTPDEKREKLLALGQKRRKSRYDGYLCLSDFHDGYYECEHVSPYTIGAGNVDSPLFVLLQDWTSVNEICGDLDPVARAKGYTPTAVTNVRLEALLSRHFNVLIRDTYATNLFPFIKKGKMSASINYSALKRAAIEYAWPQINIVRPKLVVVLGVTSFRPLADAVNKFRPPDIG